jgi:CheY-like chemotaxis protein
VTLLKIESIRADVEQIWEYWQGKGLGKWSPNCAPLIKNNLLFKQELNDNTYKRLVSLLNGKYTLRELGYKLKLDDIKIMTWLKPYVEKGLIDLIEVKDIPLKVTLMGVTNKDNKITQPTQPRLIACVDDSLQICQIMQHIVTKAGYKYIAVQDPLKALPIILRHKPDLIFLDLIMPILNGYEICTQIRRVSGLKDVPIVILTSNDGMVDRLRSKIVGASAFLGKPIDEEKVVDKINSLLISASRKEKYSSSVKT